KPPFFDTCAQQCATQYAPECDWDEKILERCFGITPPNRRSSASSLRRSKAKPGSEVDWSQQSSLIATERRVSGALNPPRPGTCTSRIDRLGNRGGLVVARAASREAGGQSLGLTVGQEFRHYTRRRDRGSRRRSSRSTASRMKSVRSSSSPST